MRIITLALVLVVISGCMSSVSMQLMRPAMITVPQHIQTVAIVNRTQASSQVLNVIEGILTGEGIGQDKEGAEQVLVGAQSRMMESTRFNVVRTPLWLKGGAAGNMPAPLTWDEVNKYCEEYKADALLVLEEYDTDWIVTNGSKPVKKKDSEGNEYTVTEFWAEGVATARIGFRLYDPKNRTIADQHRFSHNKTWSASGNSLTDAAAHLISKRIATNQISALTGQLYAERITPSWYYARREFYKKSQGNELMVKGRRMADVGNWKEAAEQWQKVVSTASAKTRGRAAYNMALANEVLGDLVTAKQWADKAYTDYGNKKARQYARIIENRMWEEEKVREQMGGDQQ